MAIPTVTEFEEGKEDLDDLESLVNGTGNVQTRLGGIKPSYSQLTSALTHGDIEAYDPSETITTAQQWRSHSGVVYRPIPSALPISPTSPLETTPNTAKWLAVQLTFDKAQERFPSRQDFIDSTPDPLTTMARIDSYHPYGSSTSPYATPKGGHYMWRTGRTNLNPTVPTSPLPTASSNGTGTQAGYAWTADGVEWALLDDNGVIFVDAFGAKGDGITDDTTAIADAITYGTGRDVVFGYGVYLSDSITIPSKTKFRGLGREDGWARLTPSTWDFSSVIKLNDGVDDSLIKVAASTVLWGIQDLILDGNKDNQTSYDSHCIETFTGSFRNFGGSISGVRCVNAKGWGGFFSSGPLNISDSFFMSGAVFHACSDLKVINTDFDGTDGLHPALVLSRTTTGTFTNCLTFAWGEVSTSDMQNASGTVNGDSTVTISAGTYLYENAPAVFDTATVSGANSNAVYFAHNINATTWEFYTHPFTNASASKVIFSPASGSITVWHGGTNQAMYASYSTGVTWNGGRIAGAVEDGLKMVESNRNAFSGIQCFNNNMASATDGATVKLVDSDENKFSACELGESSSLGARNVDWAVHTTGSSFGNKFDASNQYIGTSGTAVVHDASTASYKARNIYNGVVGVQDSGVARLSSALNLLEPFQNFASYLVTSNTTIPNTTDTTVPLTARKQKGMSVSSNTVTFAAQANTVFEISGQLGISGYDGTTTYVLIKIQGLNSAMIDGTNTEVRVSVPITSTAGVTLGIPFNFKLTCTADCVNSLIVRCFQPASGSTFQVVSDPRYSFLTIQKLADVNG